MREPGKIIENSGWVGFVSVQLFILGNVLSALLFPVLWAVFGVWILTESALISAIFPQPLLWLNIFALVVGNLFFITLAIIAPLKRKKFGLSLFGLTAPFYWLLASIASYKAFFQLLTRPYYWEKTHHMISTKAKEKRKNALQVFAAG